MEDKHGSILSGIVKMISLWNITLRAQNILCFFAYYECFIIKITLFQQSMFDWFEYPKDKGILYEH